MAWGGVIPSEGSVAPCDDTRLSNLVSVKNSAQ